MRSPRSRRLATEFDQPHSRQAGHLARRHPKRQVERLVRTRARQDHAERAKRDEDDADQRSDRFRTTMVFASGQSRRTYPPGLPRVAPCFTSPVPGRDATVRGGEPGCRIHAPPVVGPAGAGRGLLSASHRGAGAPRSGPADLLSRISDESAAAGQWQARHRQTARGGLSGRAAVSTARRQRLLLTQKPAAPRVVRGPKRNGTSSPMATLGPSEALGYVRERWARSQK